MSTAIGEKRLSIKRAERGVRQPARQSKAHPDCRSATIKSRFKKISLALPPGRDNHPLAATAKMAFLIVAVFSSRLSRYTSPSDARGRHHGPRFTISLKRSTQNLQLSTSWAGRLPHLSARNGLSRCNKGGGIQWAKFATSSRQPSLT